MNVRDKTLAKSNAALSSNAASPQPLYIQIKEVLKKQILEGQYQPHERLPSENKLMQEFQVSRITVRQALRDLTAEGLIFSSQGKGTFVNKPKAVQDVHRLEGFGEAMTAKGYDTAARLISIKTIPGPRAVTEALKLKNKSPVVEVKRVRLLNGEPISIDTSYFPESIGQHLYDRDLTGDIFPMLEQQLGTPLGSADIRLEARIAESDIAELLAIEVGNPVMWVQRLTLNTAGHPVDFEYLSIRGDAYQYHFTVERHRDALLPSGPSSPGDDAKPLAQNQHQHSEEVNDEST
ncbi:transcriptional regulator, GntR family protein [Oleiphilus messinensis]|uniref:Transcriptional regulator, GntR family protein n=1 Tax=Oleiphilus messinensis TaxID=141451 RepID=A0A1Y0IBW6_9GAMM|nr:GntR family transcriptional regulator [Oleiphilus messinensis]ARU57971.1 transcriptional regulator, GntR family protein [Oleiphilus messinensis]